MAILSYEFALCFALFFAIYWACYRRPNLQNILLTLASIAFILTWQWLFLLSITFVWLVLQACTYGFMKTDDLRAKKTTGKKTVLILGLVALIAHLCFFKYSNFVIEQLNTSSLSGNKSLTPLDIIMPIGISFYTFQAISYLVDVYQDKMQPLPSTILFGFLSFVPTLTAGPIFRAREAKQQWLLPADEASSYDDTAQDSHSLAFKAYQKTTFNPPIPFIRSPKTNNTTDNTTKQINSLKSSDLEIANTQSAIAQSYIEQSSNTKKISLEKKPLQINKVEEKTVTINDHLLSDKNIEKTHLKPQDTVHGFTVGNLTETISLPAIEQKSDTATSVINAGDSDTEQTKIDADSSEIEATNDIDAANDVDEDSPKAQWQPSLQENHLFYRVDISAGLQVGDNTPAVSAPIRPRRYVIMPYLAMALIAIALFKKLVLASWLESIWVTPVFANPLQFHGLEVLTAIYAYALQLFFDFSGYTDLVVAIALLLGFRLPENFKQPYLATDIQDFWKKWHITLSTWIKDYLYIPLGGGRRPFWRVQLNLILAFVISGVWHGAGWNFFIWGAIHGIALVFLNVLKHIGMRFWLTKHAKPVAIFLTFHYVCFGWIFFHSVTFEQALEVIGALGHYQGILFSLPIVPTLVAMASAWLIYPYLSNIRAQVARLLALLPWWSLPVPIALYVVLLFNLAPDGLPGFIYANF